MLRLLLILGTTTLLIPAKLYTQSLSESAQISLLTCAPGEEIYLSWGHSALRVKDPAIGLDKVYNYGTFDFSQPNFVLKYLRGRLEYYLNSYEYKYFVREYQYYKRSFDEQVLDLSPDQVRKVYAFLEHNNLPENRSYLYDFFYDNCATRIRDVFFDALQDSLVLENKDTPQERSMRQMLDPGLEGRPWGDFGIDLILGAVTDVPSTYWTQMFLPDYLAQSFAKSERKTTGGAVPFEQVKRNLYDSQNTIGKLPWFTYPLFCFSLLTIVVAFFSQKHLQTERRKFVWDGIWFTILGIAGIIMCLLWFATDHTAPAQNWNIMWALPTHLLLGLALIILPAQVWLKPYLLLTVLLNVCVLLGWGIIPQQFHPGIIPIVLISLGRAGIMYYKLNGFSIR